MTENSFEALVPTEYRMRIGGREVYMRPPTIAGSIRVARMLKNNATSLTDSEKSRPYIDVIFDIIEKILPELIVVVLEDSNHNETFTVQEVLSARDIDMKVFIERFTELYDIEGFVNFLFRWIQKIPDLTQSIQR